MPKKCKIPLIIPVLQMRKSELRGVELLTQGPQAIREKL